MSSDLEINDPGCEQLILWVSYLNVRLEQRLCCPESFVQSFPKHISAQTCLSLCLTHLSCVLCKRTTVPGLKTSSHVQFQSKDVPAQMFWESQHSVLHIVDVNIVHFPSFPFFFFFVFLAVHLSKTCIINL